MAGFFGRFLDSMRLNDDDEDEFEPDEDLDLDYSDSRSYENNTRRPVVNAARPNMNVVSDNTLLDLEDDEDASSRRRMSSRRQSQPASNVVPMRTNRNVSFEVCMVKPASMNDAKELCDILISGRAVVINLEGVNSELAQRVIDFASGSCYSLKGNLQSISKNIFIVTPNNIGLTGDFNSKIKKEASALNLNI